MIKIIILLTLILPLNSFAIKKKQVNNKRSAVKKIKAESKVTIDIQDNDILIKQFDKSRGTFVGTYHTSNDQTKISIIYHINPAISFSSFTDISKISTFEFAYTKKMQNYWLNLLIARTTASTDKLLESPLIDNSHDTITTFGIGLYQRFHLFGDFFESSLLYESIEANITYNLIANDTQELNFSGVGLKSDFGIFYRFSRQLHYGVKFSYNLISSQNSNNISHCISWISLGLDFSFYF
jgi:hypothetical protein